MKNDSQTDVHHAVPEPVLPQQVRLAVIVPTYGNWGETSECLRLLAQQDDANFQVILADDGSPEPPPEECLSLPFVTYLRRPHGGFAAICNAAAREAKAAGFTHLLLLNNDTAFGTGFMRGWLAKVRQFPQAIMGPLIYYHGRPKKIWYSGGTRGILTPYLRATREFTCQSAVDLLTGCALLVPVEVWHALDGLDEAFMLYFEDLDFMLRAREAGIPAYVVVEPELRVCHKVSSTALASGWWEREYRMIASRIRFIRLRYRGVEKALCMCLTAPYLVSSVAAGFPKLPRAPRLWQAIRHGMTDPVDARRSQEHG